MGKYEKLVRPRFKEIEEWIKSGATDEEVSHKLGISRRSFFSYREEHPELEGLVINAKQDTDYMIIGALFKAAIGETYYTETKIEKKDGKEHKHTVLKKLPPNVDAAKFLLTNRRPDEYKNRQDVRTEGELKLEDFR